MFKENAIDVLIEGKIKRWLEGRIPHGELADQAIPNRAIDTFRLT